VSTSLPDGHALGVPFKENPHDLFTTQYISYFCIYSASANLGMGLGAGAPSKRVKTRQRLSFQRLARKERWKFQCGKMPAKKQSSRPQGEPRVVFELAAVPRTEELEGWTWSRAVYKKETDPSKAIRRVRSLQLDRFGSAIARPE
jgi:hypothetical protein